MYRYIKSLMCLAGAAVLAGQTKLDHSSVSSTSLHSHSVSLLYRKVISFTQWQQLSVLVFRWQQLSLLVFSFQKLTGWLRYGVFYLPFFSFLFFFPVPPLSVSRTLQLLPRPPHHSLFPVNGGLGECHNKLPRRRLLSPRLLACQV